MARRQLDREIRGDINGIMLSICINTRNRAALLAETLNSMIEQMLPRIEIVVVDGASEDKTQELMLAYSSKYNFIRYFRSDDTLGIDDGYDAAVKYAVGDFCWFMTDDDLLTPGALERLRSCLVEDVDLIILNMDCFTKDVGLNLNQRFFPVYEDRLYRHGEFEDFLSDLGYGLAYIGCVVIKRSLWFEKERIAFFGTFFVHVGVILGSSLIENILFLHAPFIKYRSANSSWTARSFEIWYFKWPNLVWSFERYSSQIKCKMATPKPWQRTLTLLKSRAMGEYSSASYDKLLLVEGSVLVRARAYLISKLPVAPLSLLIILFCLIFRRASHYTLYCLMVSSPNSRIANKLIRYFGITFPCEPVKEKIAYSK